MTNPADSLAYLDTPSGISGDMFLGCLIDAGWSADRLRATVKALNLPPESWQIQTKEVMRGALRATLVHVDVAEGDAHRHLSDIRQIIESADLPSPVQQSAVAVFTRLAEAEATIHGTTPERIHFHEVGALDAIIDVVGACAGLHEMGIERLFAGPLPLGHGWTDSMHGRIPLPAPATLELLSATGAPTRPAPGPGELVTPTGAALLAALATFQQPPMTLQRVGYGAGQKEFDWPNVARLWLGREVAGGSVSNLEDQRSSALSAASASHCPVVLLETNIDDMVPELYGAVSERLFAAGALDVWTTPIGMKKNRPGVLLSVLAAAEQEEALADLLLRETTTLGVRVQTLRRHVARREIRSVETQFGTARVKLKWIDDDLVGAAPEYEDCRRLAAAADAPVRQVYEAVQAAAHRRFLAAD